MDPVPENERLRKLLAERDEAMEQQRDALAAAIERNAALEAELEAAREVAARLERDIEKLKRQLTGPKSERSIDPNQLPLPLDDEEIDEDAADGESDDDASDDEDEVVSSYRRKKGGRGRRKVAEMDHLRTVVHEELVEERRCPCGCGAEAETLRKEVTWRLEEIPAELVRHKHVKEIVTFPEHDGKGPKPVKTAPYSVSYALPKAMCGNRLLARIVLDKYADHLPLYRQEQRFAREGFDLSRQTMCDWVMNLADVLSPIRQQMELEVLSGSWLRADATGMPVYDPARVTGRTHHGNLWAYGNYEAVLFAYTPRKTAETLASLLEGFSGTLLIDGATEFNLVERTQDVTRAGCWSHARRYFYESISYDSQFALRGLGAIRRLFLAERKVMSAPLDERLDLREELCKPVVDGIRTWVDEQLPKKVQGYPAHQALQYLDNQWDRLIVFLETKEIACHNNDTERDLRRPVKGKANWHYARSPRGARAMALYYTLIGTCLLQGLDPRRYLVEVLGRLDEPAVKLTPAAIREEWERPPADP